MTPPNRAPDNRPVEAFSQDKTVRPTTTPTPSPTPLPPLRLPTSHPGAPPPGGPPGATAFEMTDRTAFPEAMHEIIPGYQVEQSLSVASGEADLYLVRRKTDGEAFVLKHYRFGIAPKAEILEAVRQLPQDCAVQILDMGKANGRLYELQEFIPNGTLADLFRSKAITASNYHEVFRQLARAVIAMHAANILHRDIKPSNILVRSKQPLKLVFTDFGISSIATHSLHLTSANRTIFYSAPEAITGVLSRASDWWSIGVMVLEMLMGRHPFEGLNDRMVNFRLVSDGIVVPDTLPFDWSLLARGLLTRDANKRWGSDQVEMWMTGRLDIACYYEGGTAIEQFRPYRFANQEFRQPAALAQAMAEHWYEALPHVGSDYVHAWVRDEVKDQGKAANLREILLDRQLDQEQKLSITLMVLSPAAPLIWKGQIVTRAWMRGNRNEVPQLLSGTLPQWHQRLTREDTLIRLLHLRDQVHHDVERFSVRVDSEVLEDLVLMEPEDIQAVWQERSPAYRHMIHPLLAGIASKPDLSVSEMVVLLSADESLFQTPEQAIERQKQRVRLNVEALALPLDWNAAGRFIENANWDELGSEWKDRKSRYVSSTDPRLAVMLQAAQPTFSEAVAVASAPTNLFLTDAQRRLRRTKTWFGSGVRQEAVFSPHRGQVTAMRFSADGALLFTAGEDGILAGWKMPSGKAFKQFSSESLQRSIAVTRDASIVASAGAGPHDIGAQIWDVQTGDCVGIAGADTDHLMCVEIDPTAEVVAGGSRSSVVYLWSLRTGVLIDRFQPGGSALARLRFSPDGLFLAAGTQNGEVVMWNMDTGAAVIRAQEPMFVENFLFSPDSSRLHAVFSSTDSHGQVKVCTWDTESLEQIRATHFEMGDAVGTATMAPHEQWLLVSLGRRVCLVDPVGGKVHASLPLLNSDVRHSVFSSDGNWAATGTRDGSVSVWNLAGFSDKML